MKFLVHRSWFLVHLSTGFAGSLSLMLALSFVFDLSAANEEQSTKNQEQRVFRPETGKFPPADKAKTYMGELVFVDHANRRGRLRVPVEGKFANQAGSPFAMLPYGMVRYHGAPADLRDIPLGTILHGRFYRAPNPKFASVPDVNTENHAILLEDEPSFCLRESKVWKLKEVEFRGDLGLITARREAKAGGTDDDGEQKMTIDATTRFWRGSERLRLADMIAKEGWPDSGTKSLGDQPAWLGLTWQPVSSWVNSFTQFHVSDVWLDESAMQLATQDQSTVHKAFIRSRWMPAWVDAVEYGKFGEATVTATLFGGMDPSLYADFKKGGQGQIGAATETLKHAEAASAGQSHMAIRGPFLDVMKQDGEVPLGSSGIQIRIKVDLVLEGFRPGRIVRIRPMSWPNSWVPREEFLSTENGSLEERYPTPAIFSK